LQKATSAQKQISDVENTISKATKSGGSDPEDRKGNDKNNGKDDNWIKPRGAE
jgi:hypothetical protein